MSDVPPRPTDSDPDAGSTSTDLVPTGAESRQLAHPVPVSELVEQASDTVLGFALLLGDGVRAVAQQVVSPAALPARSQDDPGPMTTGRRVALGLALDAQRRALVTTETVMQVTGPTVRWLVSNPLFRVAVGPVRRRIDEAYEVGFGREQLARTLASRTSEQTVALAVPVVLDNVDLGPVVTQVIDGIDLKPVIDKVIGELDLPAIVDNVMGELDLSPIVDKVLGEIDMQGLIDQVVGEIQMSSVVMQATGGITQEVVGKVRDRGADGDALMTRIASVLRRRTADELPPLAFPGTARDADHEPGESGDDREHGS